MTTPSSAPAASAPDTPTTTRMIIGGESVDAAGGQTFEIVNPANGTVVATAPLGGRADVDKAVAAATTAFEERKGWANWAAGKRGRSLAKLADADLIAVERRGKWAYYSINDDALEVLRSWLS